MTTKIDVNSPRAWWLACRPKTLTGAVAPVMVALAAAWHDIGQLTWWTAALCMTFAMLMQVDANLVNDYFDGVNGRDGEDRLGPERAVQMGWITPSAMRVGLIVCTLLSCIIGLPLAFVGGWHMVMVGVACVVFCFLYTTTLSHMGLGDLLVLVFFGLVPVCCTYYLQTGTVNMPIVLYSIAMGLSTDNLLIVNNYRDRHQDRANGKRTLVVMMGGRWALRLYLLLSLMAIIVTIPYSTPWLMVLYLVIQIRNYVQMKRIHQGRELNSVLGSTAMGILLFAILLSMQLLFL